jgi:hypothetical protein
MSPRSTGHSRTTYLLATVVAAALGGVLAVAAVMLGPQRAQVEPPPPPAEQRKERRRSSADVRRRADAERPATRRDRAAAGARAARDPELERRLSAPDERTRLLAARDLLREGTGALVRLRAVEPATSEGQALVGQVERVLADLALNERASGYGRLTEDSRLELRLEHFARVLPEELLREERRHFWQRRVETDRLRVERGAALDGELALSELELGRLQLELGELDPAGYAALRAARMGAARAWVEAQRTRRDVPPAVALRQQQQLERLER